MTWKCLISRLSRTQTSVNQLFFLFELRYFSKEFNSKGIRTRVSYRVQLSRGFSRLPFTESLLAGQSFKEREHTRIVCPLAVADLDLQIRRERSSRPWIKGGGGGLKKFGLKIRGGGPPGPSPGSASVWVHFFPILPQSDTFKQFLHCFTLKYTLNETSPPQVDFPWYVSLTKSCWNRTETDPLTMILGIQSFVNIPVIFLVVALTQELCLNQICYCSWYTRQT